MRSKNVATSTTSDVAGVPLAPYLAVVCYASALNAGIVALNRA
jgi:tryptophan-rich sensory protein